MTTMARLETPFVSTLPGRYYYDPAIYEMELERIFSQMWVCVGRADAITGAGAYEVVTVGRESIIVVRGRDDVLRAFLNVCRHRGARLCNEASGKLKGSIQCRYHAWTYGLDGRLIGAPNVLSDEQFERALFGLLPVALEVWEGLVWLNLGDDPASIADQLNEPIIERFGGYAAFARYDVGNLKVGKRIAYDMQANWKLVLENFMECYHCGPMHPEFCRLLPGYKTGDVSDYVNGEAVSLAENVEAFTITGKASRPPLRGLLQEDLRHYYGFVLQPNVLLNLLHDHVVMHWLIPNGPGRTVIMCDWLFDPQVMARADFDPMDAVEIFDIVNRQDWEVCELTQLGMGSKAYRSGGVYVPEERHIRAFADFVLERVG
ncbi:MAG: 2Fe-2S ferredoxin [Ktedonobacter sp. 13_2_20CM_2_56_8]|nr:MAG: 2Fe-2S ferredoxin [Ktedonobacter sp. 13_2_20CM_2_56_8]